MSAKSQSTHGAFRTAQREFMRGVDRYGVTGFLARRQYGKTTIFSAIALKKMMKKRGHTVVFGSVKLNLGREIVRKESEIIRNAVRDLQLQAAESDGLLKTYDSETGKDISKIADDDYAELFEAQRLEFRYYHDRLDYSRTKVVALRPDSVGETGDLMCDEIGRLKNWQEVWEAVEPIIQSNPEFRCTLATTPAPDDAHYSNQMLVWPVGTDLPINPAGNWYRSDFGIWVLRVDAFDAFADGVPVYDLETREPLSPQEHRRRAMDKDAWDRNYGVKFVLGGTSAIGTLPLNASQQRGMGQCLFVLVEEESDFARGLEFLAAHVGPGPLGLGWDLATTEQATSNPSAFTVIEGMGAEWKAPVTLAWKTADPALAKYRARKIIETCNTRKQGGRARRLCIDATNERYFAKEVQRELGHLVPIELVIASETVELPGGESLTLKALLGNQLANDVNDNRATLAPERYIKDDFRRVKRDRGSFSCELGPNGEHGDTFDSHKLGRHALTTTKGAINVETLKKIRIGGNVANRRIFTPKRLV